MNNKSYNLLKVILKNNSKKISVLFIVFLIELNHYQCFSQNSYRRHFLMAYDISENFRDLERNNFRYQRTIEDLFNNLKIENAEGNSNVLLSEKKAGKLFFDPEQDEISFYHFNISANEINSLKRIDLNDPKVTISSFTNAFIKSVPITWSAYKMDRKGPNIVDFMNNVLRLQFNPAETSAPNLVYPLIMNILNNAKPAEEYILIILTHILPDNYNDQDMNYINAVFSGTQYFNPDNPDDIIGNQIDNLNKSFRKTEYFNYTIKSLRGDNQSIGIYGYNISPQGINANHSSPAIALKSKIVLSQTGFGSEIFKLSPLKFSFQRNNSLIPDETVITISRQNEDNKTALFTDTVRYLRFTGKWISKNITDNKLIKLKYNRSTLKLPKRRIALEGFDSKSDFNDLRFNFKFITQLEPPDSKPVSYIFNTEKAINETNVEIISFDISSLINQLKNIFLHILLPIIISGLILFLIFYGKPKGIELTITGILDSILMINYRTFGQKHTPYKAWELPFEDKQKFRAEGKIRYHSLTYIFNWKLAVELKINDKDLIVPEGFSVSLISSNNPVTKYRPGKILVEKLNNENKIEFFICIGLDEVNTTLTEPKFFRIKLESSIRLSGFFTGGKIRKNIIYEFHIGEDLGEIWVGLDPGTTGSCSAIGNPQTRRFILGEYLQKGHKPIKIIPSKIIFDKSQDYEPGKSIIPSRDIYKYGIEAEFEWLSSLPSMEKFQSFKKMLGYCDIRNIKFANGKNLPVSGKLLSAIIIKGMYDDLRNYLAETDTDLSFGSRTNDTYVFNPKRAVIAVPNNSTIMKIQDIIESAESLGQFKEVRYIYEAEAVLFYYLKNYSKYNTEKKFEEETILIFDMGGATINATVISGSKKEEDNRIKYNINILGKIGYSVGGDTIDYCIARSVLKFSDEFPQLRSITIDGNRDDLIRLAREIKENDIYNNFIKGYDYLITDKNLQDAINGYLKPDPQIRINNNSNIHNYFNKNNEGRFPLFTDPLFKEIIYDNVRDAIIEVLDLSENRRIDTVLFSGRSTHFPYIRETVEQQIKKRQQTFNKVMLDLDDSKTAVAEGACWYGIINNNINLNNLKTYASFGVGRTLDATIDNIEFIPIIESGLRFSENNGTGGLYGKVNLKSDFNYDGHNVNFYQIMGREGQKILENHQLHKLSRIASFKIESETESLGMIVKENDDIFCQVKEINADKEISRRGAVSDQEIESANEEHYTWVLNL